MAMHRVALIHWNEVERVERAAQLREAGFDVPEDKVWTPAALKAWRVDPPAAVAIDLSRLPAQGRDVGLAIRHYKSTRHVPLVFVGGQSEKVARVRQSLPDAVYTTWGRIDGSLRRAIARPPTDPVVPKSLMDGYSGTPLPRKLGIRANSIVCLVGAPKEFEKTLGRLPEGVTLRRRAQGRCDLAVWFTTSRREVERRIERLGGWVGKGGLWVAWPKKTSGVQTNLSQVVVRKVGLASGLVDYKICSIDATWTGLRFSRRKTK